MANSSTGDPRAVFVLNLVLSATFSVVVVYALSLVGALAFRWRTVAVATLALALVTHLVSR